jgi:cytochrome c556
MARPTTAGALAPLAAAALMIFVASFAVPRAQQPQAPAQQPQTPAPAAPAGAAPAKPLLPIAVNTLVARPDAYVGERVTLTAAVNQILSRTAFAVSQRKVACEGGQTEPAGGDVLVVSPILNSPVDLDKYVTVSGEVLRFDPAEIAAKARAYKLDLAPDVVEKYRGRPAVLATSVINAAFVDLAKRLPPPMAADEKVYDDMMKQVGPAFAALRNADASNAEATTKNVAILKQAFAQTETFWKGKGKADAIEWSQNARKQVDSIEKAAAGGNWEALKTSAGTLGQACQTCHAAYRERFDDGSFRIKTPGTGR